MLYYTFTKRWFTDAMNFADLPSLHEATDDHDKQWRDHFPNVIKQQADNGVIFCDGAAGSQVPHVVIDRMTDHLKTLGSTNITYDHALGKSAVQVVTRARQAAKDLLGTGSTGEIAFGLNCTNLMFQVARSIENAGNNWIKSGDNIVLSRACHDANISPWLLMAKKLNLEVRWLDCKVR